MHFVPHGSVSIELIDHILVLRAKGPWNQELIQQYLIDVGPYKDKLKCVKWGVLLIAYGEPIMLEDASETLALGVLKDADIGRVATAIIINTDIGKELSKSIFTRIYSKTSNEFAFFEDEMTAKNWLNNTIKNY